MHALFRLCAVAGLALALAAPAIAHDGHDHHDAPPPAPSATPRAEAMSETFELVAVARDGTLEIYLDRGASNEPVINAGITVETPAGSVAATPVKDAGTYTLAAPWAQQPGKYDLIFTITTADGADVLPATLEIPLAAAAASGDGNAVLHFVRDLSPGMIALLAAFGGGVVGAGLARRRRATAASLIVAFAVAAPHIAFGQEEHDHHEGHDHGPASSARSSAPPAANRDLAYRLPDGSLFVPKATQRLLVVRTAVTEQATHRRTIELPGRIVPDPNASGYVQASVAGRLSSPEAGFPRLGTRVKMGDVLAYVTPPLQAIDVSDMRQRQGELDQQISILEQRIARFEQLVSGGAATKVQLEEARLELKGLLDRRSALDRIRREPEALVAPVSGVVAEVNAVAGQIAQPNLILFQIVEPTRLWIEALSFDPLAAGNATARLADGRTLPISYQGSGFSDRSQAVPVHFRIDADTAGLRLGQLVTVFAETEQEQSGIALPRAAVVRTQNGQTLVFEHVSPERFVAHNVRVEPHDGERVLVLSGLSPAMRVVTQGAELLDQVR